MPDRKEEAMAGLHAHAEVLRARAREDHPTLAGMAERGRRLLATLRAEKKSNDD